MTPIVRDLHIARRYQLRRRLASCLDVPAAGLRFRYGAFGKPRLAEAGPLHFNQTGSGDQTFIAVAETSIGIDAEHIDQRNETDLRRWTAREAVTKAVGCGLGHEIGLDISWDEHIPHMRRIGHDDPAAWTLESLVWEENVIVTVAVRSPKASLHLHPAYAAPETAHP